MIALIQRVSKAEVKINEKIISEIKKGIVVFLGIERGDNKNDIDYIVKKIINLRIFEDSLGKMNLSVVDVNGEILIVSEFTLAGDCSRGNRPSFDKAMPPEEAEKLYLEFIKSLKEKGVPVKEGIFKKFMHVCLINEGPVTFIINSR